MILAMRAGDGFLLLKLSKTNEPDDYFIRSENNSWCRTYYTIGPQMPDRSWELEFKLIFIP